MLTGNSRTSVTRGNGTSSAIAYDPVSRLSSLTQDMVGTTSDLTINGFNYNPASQIGALTRNNDSYAWGGHYNVNRNYTVNGLNQMSAAGATSLGYDARGNLTTSGANAYTYSSENLLKTGPASATLDYDPAMRLYQTVGAGVTTRFGYDGSDLVAEYNGSNTLLRRYVPGPGTDEPLVWYEGTGTADRRWLHTDERGSVIGVTNASGTSIAINAYDEYGIPASTNLGRFQYTGQTWISELGMYYYKARMYSPTLGRFMQTDPIGYDDGINWYNYVGSDPVNFTDPSGLFVGYEIIVNGPKTNQPRPPRPPSGGGAGAIGGGIGSGSGGPGEPNVGAPDIVVTGQRQANATLGAGSLTPGQGMIDSCSILFVLDFTGKGADVATLALAGGAAAAAATGAGAPVATGLGGGAAVANAISRTTSLASGVVYLYRGDAVGVVTSAAAFFIGGKSVERFVDREIRSAVKSYVRKNAVAFRRNAILAAVSNGLTSASSCPN